MITFDGKEEAELRKEHVREKIKELPQLKIFALVFQEDQPSIIYTNLKKKDAESVGVGYEAVTLPIATPVTEIQRIIHEAVIREDIHGIIVQKPAKSLLPTVNWWQVILQPLIPEKDVDGLTPETTVLPATARAILTILDIARVRLQSELEEKTAVVVGRSDIVGAPVAHELEEQGLTVHLLGRKEFAEKPHLLKSADVVITATGQSNLVDASMLKKGVIVIDAGSPNPEVNLENLDQVASFLSPVPGGVGPMTRVSLLENLVDLVQYLH
jgi:5,10-methylene-tetrahydrofolate dehydrogenase/methenyl tetrahydrofolate cyclohydrolase